MMNKYIAILLLLTVLLLTGCGNDATAQTPIEPSVSGQLQQSEPSESEEDPQAQLQERYAAAKKAQADYEQYGKLNTRQGPLLEGEKALQYLYSEFSALSEQMDVSEELSHFAYIKRLISTSYVMEDRLGNQTKGAIAACTVRIGDETVTFESKAQLLEQYGVFYSGDTKSFDFEFTTDESGNVTQLKVKQYNKVYAIMTPAYDTDGRIISVTGLEKSREYTVYYHYDAAGRLTGIEPGGEWGSPHKSYRYTYDSEGRMTSKVEGGSGYIYQYLYTYDDAGRVLQLDLTRHPLYLYEWDGKVAISYAYDEAGNPVSAQMSFTASEEGYVSGTASYSYRTVLVYTP